MKKTAKEEMSENRLRILNALKEAMILALTFQKRIEEEFRKMNDGSTDR